jgi:hypothetical protein
MMNWLQTASHWLAAPLALMGYSAPHAVWLLCALILVLEYAQGQSKRLRGNSTLANLLAGLEMLPAVGRLFTWLRSKPVAAALLPAAPKAPEPPAEAKL